MANELTIIQGFKSIYDPLVPLHTGDFVPSLIGKPTVYVKNFGKYKLYVFYHWCDWSELPWLIRSLDEHRFDLEAVFVGPGISLSIFHRDIKVLYRRASQVFIQAGGHGVEFTQKWTGAWIYYPPGSYEEVLMTDKFYDYVAKHLALAFKHQGVSTPQQLEDRLLRKAYELLTA